MFNNKGQAASTFQLLIAAIVAIAILGVLMGILGIIPKPPGQEPIAAATEVLNKASTTSMATPVVSKEATFNKDYPTLAAVSLAKGDVGITENQINLSLGFFKDKAAGFTKPTEKVITYTGTSKKVKIGALCATGCGELNRLADEVFTIPGDSSAYQCTCEDEICCVVYLLSVT